jgi:hypothetical protein
MQVKTQLLLEDIAKWLAVIFVVAVALYVTRLEDDNETDTDFPKHTNTIDVHVKQGGGINSVVYKDCVLLGEKVEC